MRASYQDHYLGIKAACWLLQSINEVIESLNSGLDCADLQIKAVYASC